MKASNLKHKLHWAKFIEQGIGYNNEIEDSKLK